MFQKIVPDYSVYNYFWFGEVGMAAVLAGVFAVPAGIYLAGRTGIALAFILEMIVSMPLFVFLPKLIRREMKADMQAVVEAFGKNEQVMNVIWALVIAIAGLVLARVVDPVTTQQIIGIITGRGGERARRSHHSHISFTFDNEMARLRLRARGETQVPKPVWWRSRW